MPTRCVTNGREGCSHLRQLLSFLSASRFLKIPPFKPTPLCITCPSHTRDPPYAPVLSPLAALTPCYSGSTRITGEGRASSPRPTLKTSTVRSSQFPSPFFKPMDPFFLPSSPFPLQSFPTLVFSRIFWSFLVFLLLFPDCFFLPYS
jgi:hypothetical protein